MPNNKTLVLLVVALAAVVLVATTVSVTLWLAHRTPAQPTAASTPRGGTIAESSSTPAPSEAPAPSVKDSAPRTTRSAEQRASTPAETQNAAPPEPGTVAGYRRTQPPESSQPGTVGGYAATPSTSQATQAGAGVFINERELTPQLVRELIMIYRYPPPHGHFWYDSRSGLYGIWGHEAAGYIHPGHDLGPLPSNASRGDTGVFINGREINRIELSFLQVLFNGQVRQGRAWLDGRTWNIGVEGSPIPIANLAAELQQAQQRSRGGNSQWGWRDGSGAVIAGDGNCTMMAVPGAPVYSAGGC